MKSSFKKQLLISFGIILAAVVAAGVGLYILSGDISATADKIVNDKALVARQTAAVGVLADLESEAPKAASYTQAMNALLPIHDELIGFSSWLATTGNTYHVTVSFSFTGKNTGASASIPGTDGFAIIATGSEADLTAFLQYLESGAPQFLLTIDSFTFTSQASGYQLSAQGRLFSRPQ